MESKPQLYMIGNAHLDPVWLWRWQEGLQEVKATFRSALDRMNEYEEFVFTSSQAVVYEWIERNEPAMFEEIRRRVAEGRWVLCGGWWIQSDCNLPSGESFVRQALYGQRYFLEKFGVISTVGYNVDSFGHHAMLPQLLKKAGMDAYVFMRPGEHEKHLDYDLFWWESDDGSRVLTYRIPFYTHLSFGETPDAFERSLEHQLREATADRAGRMVFYGVGNHGGGPTKANIERIRELQRGQTAAELRFSSPPQFFASAGVEDDRENTIPTLRDELQMHAKGCYSVHAQAKIWNRRTEQLLVTAEKFAATAALVTNHPFAERDRMTQAWKSLLFNQFHDILPGSSIEAAYDDARDLYGEANAIAGRALHEAVQSLSWRIAIQPEEGMKPIVVFNPHGWPVKTNIQLEFGHFGFGREFHSFRPGDYLVDERDAVVPIQEVQSESTTVWRQRLSFVAELPPLGYRTFRIRSGETRAAETARTGPADAKAGSARASDHVLENEWLRLELDPDTGWIAGLYDKRTQVELFRGPAAQPVVIDDPSDTWSHGIERYDMELGPVRATHIRLVEEGPVQAVILAEYEYGRSLISQRFTVYRELAHVEVSVTVDWRERFKMLKLRFPVQGSAEKTTYEIPYGTIARANDGLEMPGLSWFDQSGSHAGLSILNDGKYSFDCQGSVMNLTVLRSPIFAYDRSKTLDPNTRYTYMDQGIHRFTYVLLPHAGDWREAGTVRRAAELNQPPIPVIETYHEGDLPQTGSYLVVEGADSASVVISAIKQAEDGGGIILRCVETAGRPANVKIVYRPLNRTIEAAFGPCEIKTFRVPLEPALPIEEVDFLERPCERT